ncbi:hypothetical protein HMPREF1042_0387 [Streptococcus constellatus subsp. pharyngis SK1060 = CCUG 46377]|uniref:Uncharacterized protein n=1 Tax=Streptococcus constellatus subsp. pharyngis SK1060 = CCUG 46377 TaxID=1035184 RepID=F9P4J0_STRCV|nr:hypothetical protein HMPREF1042_0387 [Streptococcus constellatus subsp. pharyngis SK1060 = CCUG 46377]
MGGEMIIENSILTEEQIKGIDEKYSHLKDTDVIESLGCYEMDSEQNNLVITEFPINKEDLIEISNQISNIQQEFERLKVMYKMFISDVFDFLKLNSELEKKNKGTNELDVNRFMMHLLSSGKLFVDFAENQIKTKHRQKFKNFINLLVNNMTIVLLIDFAIILEIFHNMLEFQSLHFIRNKITSMTKRQLLVFGLKKTIY